MARRQHPFQGDLFVTDALVYTAPRDALAAELTEALRALFGAAPRKPWKLRDARRDLSGAIIAALDIEGEPRHELRVIGSGTARQFQWLAPQTSEPFGLHPDRYARAGA